MLKLLEINLALEKNYKFRKFYRFRFNFQNDLIIRINTHGICKHPHFHNIKNFLKIMLFIRHKWFFKITNKSKILIKKDYPFKSNRNLIIDSFISKILKRKK